MERHPVKSDNTLDVFAVMITGKNVVMRIVRMSQRRISRTLKRTFVDQDPASIPEKTVGVIQMSSVCINRDSNLSARFMAAFF